MSVIYAGGREFMLADIDGDEKSFKVFAKGRKPGQSKLVAVAVYLEPSSFKAEVRSIAKGNVYRGDFISSAMAELVREEGI
jgi:hypothetical protein